jgi:Uma2 family endonuclease
MSLGPSAPPLPALAPPCPLRRFTVDEYHRLLQVGILEEGDPVELLDGFLVLKTRASPPQNVSLGLLEDLLNELLPAGWFRRGRSAVTTADSEPEPGLAVVRGQRRDYGKRHPGPQDLALVIEVSDTSLARDRNVKATLYARASIPVYWIVNLIDHRVEVHTDPSGPDPQPTYRRQTDHGEADAVPLVLDGVEVTRIPVRDLLP